MNDHHDPLEQELAGLKPRQPSPALRQRVGARLSRPLRRFWIAVVLAGACTGLCLYLVVFSKSSPPATAPVNPPPASAPPAQPDESQPTLQTYRRALSRSADEFEALLDRQAAVSTESTALTAGSRTEFVSFGEH